MDQSFRLASRAGVRIAFGTDASVYTHGENAREFAIRVRLGQSPLEAIRGATRLRRAGAQAWRPRGDCPGEAGRPGRGPGRSADDIGAMERIAFVMKGGAVQDLSRDSVAAGPVVIRAARMIDVEKGTVVSPGVVVVDSGRIRAAGDRRIPAGARAIDLGDLTLLPGLIDAHTHLTVDIDKGWELRAAAGDSRPTARCAARATPATTLRAGFTTVRDVGGSALRRRGAHARHRRRLGAGPADDPRRPRDRHHRRPLRRNRLGARGAARTGPRRASPTAPTRSLRAVRNQAKYGAKVIKLCATAGVLSHDATVGAQQLSDAEMVAAVEEAERHGLQGGGPRTRPEGIMAAVRAGVDSIEHGSMLTDEALALMKERGTWLVPTTTLRDIELRTFRRPSWRSGARIASVAKESLRRAIQAGVKIALGTDAGVLPHGQNGREVAAMVDRGMTPADAIRAGTMGVGGAARPDRPRTDRGGQGGGSDRGGGEPAGGSHRGAAGAVGDEGRRGGAAKPSLVVAFRA